MARVFLAEAGQCRPLECCAHAYARLRIFIPVFYCKLYIGEVIGLCCNKLAVYSPSTKLYTNCSPALSPQMSAVRRILLGGMFRCSRVASSGRDGRWRFFRGRRAYKERCICVCFPVARSGRAGGGNEAAPGQSYEASGWNCKSLRLSPAVRPCRHLPFVEFFRSISRRQFGRLWGKSYI